MNARWWTILFVAVAAKLYLLASWLWSADDQAHALPPVVEVAAPAKPGTTSAAKVPVQEGLDVDEVAAEASGASSGSGSSADGEPHDKAKGEAAALAELQPTLERLARARSSAKDKKKGDADDPGGGAATGSGAAAGSGSGAVAAPDVPIDTPATESPLVAASPKACLAALASVTEERKLWEARRAGLAQREQALRLREEAVQKILVESTAVSKRAEAAVQRALDERKQGRTERTVRLAKLLAVMKPAEAAQVVGRLKVAHAVAALGEMDEPHAGKILAFLAPERGAEVSEALLALPRPTETATTPAASTTAAPPVKPTK